jgi:hypothetical protein
VWLSLRLAPFRFIVGCLPRSGWSGSALLRSASLAWFDLTGLFWQALSHGAPISGKQWLGEEES